YAPRTRWATFDLAIFTKKITDEAKLGSALASGISNRIRSALFCCVNRICGRELCTARMLSAKTENFRSTEFVPAGSSSRGYYRAGSVSRSGAGKRFEFFGESKCPYSGLFAQYI